MIYRRLDINGDYQFGQGQYNYLKDVEAVSQAIKTKLLLLYAEWWEDLEEGTPLFQSILVQRNTQEGKNAIDMIIRDRILNTQGVLQISSFESKFEQDKSYSVTMSVETEYGTANDITIDLGF